MNEIEAQRRYYADTAAEYDRLHLHKADEHVFALHLMASAISYLDIKSVLDVGAGTGRAIDFLKQRFPKLQVLGIEPVKELRELAYSKGISRDELIDGDGTQLQMGDSTFDLVCEFGVLHHISKPERAISEMLRVARKGIFISDCNNFGNGPMPSRFLKQLLNLMKLWPLADFIKTRGRGYTLSAGDGVSYSYSVFDSYAHIQKFCKRLHLTNTTNASSNLYRTASHVALLGIKD